MMTGGRNFLLAEFLTWSSEPQLGGEVPRLTRLFLPALVERLKVSRGPEQSPNSKLGEIPCLRISVQQECFGDR